jgi:ABC-type antimicrobial peptide transport system permease subunit
VVFLNITERAPELAALRSFGWREAALARLVITEGAIIGVVGSLAGAGLGLGAAAWFAGHLPARLIAIAAAAAAAGMVAADVTFTIEAGTSGASGSGKSTLLHMTGAIERPTPAPSSPTAPCLADVGARR